MQETANIHETNGRSVTEGLPELRSLARDLRRMRPHLPSDPSMEHDMQGIASNLIEQTKEVEKGNMRAFPFMAKSTAILKEWKAVTQ